MFRESKGEITSGEETEWTGVKKTFMNTKTVIVSSLATLTTALYQIHQSTSIAKSDIKNTFAKIENGLKNNSDINALLTKMASEISQKTEAGVASAQETLNKLIETINTVVKGDPVLIAEAERMKDYILKKTDDHNLIRAIAVGGPAIIITGVLLVDFLQQFKKTLRPSHKPHLVIGGTLALGMITLLTLRARACFGSDYENASSRYMCSQAHDDTARAFNNFLIELGFFAGADVLMRLMNSCFIQGVKSTANNIGSAIYRAPGAAMEGLGTAWTRVTVWARPGDTVLAGGEGRRDVEVRIDDDRSAAKTPLLRASAPSQ